MGTHHIGRNGCKLLAVVPISTCSVTVGGATKLVGFVHQIPSKSLLVPPFDEAVVANIMVSPVDRDDSSVGDSQ
jgi:hypothetical protein